MDNIKITPTGRVYLYLPDKQYKPKRQLGIIKSRVFHSFRDPTKHLFKKTNSLGINFELLKCGGSHFDHIFIQYGFTQLFTGREYYLHNGHFLEFQANDLEKQVFLPINMFGIDKLKEWEAIQYRLSLKPNIKNPALQGNLFL